MSLFRFYWLLPGQLAGCSCPGVRIASSPPDALGADLAWLRAAGIGAVLSLTEWSLPEASLAGYDLTGLHLPVPDFHPPTLDQIDRALEFIDARIAEGRPPVVHCLAGQGRTGTVLAAYLIRAGLPADQAIARIRAICPGAIESPPQVQALFAFAGNREWVL